MALPKSFVLFMVILYGMQKHLSDILRIRSFFMSIRYLQAHAEDNLKRKPQKIVGNAQAPDGLLLLVDDTEDRQ